MCVCITVLLALCWSSITHNDSVQHNNGITEASPLNLSRYLLWGALGKVLGAEAITLIGMLRELNPEPSREHGFQVLPEEYNLKTFI